MEFLGGTCLDFTRSINPSSLSQSTCSVDHTTTRRRKQQLIWGSEPITERESSSSHLLTRPSYASQVKGAFNLGTWRLIYGRRMRLQIGPDQLYIATRTTLPTKRHSRATTTIFNLSPSVSALDTSCKFDDFHHV